MPFESMMRPQTLSHKVDHEKGQKSSVCPSGCEVVMYTDMLEFRSYTHVTESHDHPFWQVVLPVRGRLDMEVGGRAGFVQPGQGAVIPAGTAHAFQAEGDNRFLVADVKSLVPEGHATERFGRHAFFGIAPPIKALLDYRAAASEFSSELAGHWVALLLSSLAQTPPADRGAGMVVERAIAFMAKSLAEPISVTDIAAAAEVPVHRLNAAFRALEGVSPYAHLTRLRFERALDLLVETRLPIAEIAGLTGHSDQSALTRRLRKHMGIGPAAYRRARLSQTA